MFFCRFIGSQHRFFQKEASLFHNNNNIILKSSPTHRLQALASSLAMPEQQLQKQASSFDNIKSNGYSISPWSKVPLGPPDAILGITEAFKADTHPQKINLGVGAYRDDQGKPYVLECVLEAEKRILGKDKEYAGIGGIKGFIEAAIKLAYSQELLSKLQVSAVQSISGTGALRIGAAFISRFYKDESTNSNPWVLMPTPTWGNHGPIMKDSGLQTKQYRYFDTRTNGLDLAGMLEDLQEAPSRSVVLLHACAHNPTGVDPTPDQWNQVLKVMKDRGHFAFFDMAYQGFASGDPDQDAYAVRLFATQQIPMMLAQSFAKNFGLYGERVGALSIPCPSHDVREAVDSQLKILIRPMYSNPPIHGARIVECILNDSQLNTKWHNEVKLMASRIIEMRRLLREHLEVRLKNPVNWSHITSQIGMFCYTGLRPEQVSRLTSEHHVYLTKDGRISIAGINSSNVERLAKAIHAVTTN